MTADNRAVAPTPKSVPPPVDHQPALFPLLASLLEYPSSSISAKAAECLAAIAETSQEAAGCLATFGDVIKAWPAERLEEMYVRTFDVAPQCVPYVSVHVFGEESFKRAQLMTGLQEAYERAGFDPGRELPDHLAVILRFFPVFSEEERSDMTRYCLHDALAKMIASIKSSENPYRHLLSAVNAVLRHRYPKEGAHA